MILEEKYFNIAKNFDNKNIKSAEKPDELSGLLRNIFEEMGYKIISHKADTGSIYLTILNEQKELKIRISDHKTKKKVEDVTDLNLDIAKSFLENLKLSITALENNKRREKIKKEKIKREEPKELTKKYQKSIDDTILNLTKEPVSFFNEANLEEVMNTFKTLENRDIENNFTGLSTKINNKQRKRILDYKNIYESIKNGFTKTDYYSVSNNIEKIFREATIIVSREDRNNEENVLSIKNFISVFEIKDNTGYVSLVMKETKDHGNRVWNLELQKQKDTENMLKEYFLKKEKES